jgi:cytidine deaminase
MAICKNLFKSLWHYLDIMISRRLPLNTNGTPILKCTNTMHSALIFKESGNRILPLSFGENWIYQTVRFNPQNINLSAHAEHAAVLNLPKSKKITNVNIFVIKYKLTGCLGPSEPCKHCLEIMSNLALKKGFKIKKVYFTNREKNIEMQSLNDLIKDPYVTRLGQSLSPWHCK